MNVINPNVNIGLKTARTGHNSTTSVEKSLRKSWCAVGT